MTMTQHLLQQKSKPSIRLTMIVVGYQNTTKPDSVSVDVLAHKDLEE